MEYQTINLTGTYFTLNGWFFMFRPVFVPYSKIAAKVQDAGLSLKTNSDKGMLEYAPMLGLGWIGLEINETNTDHPRVKKLSGEYTYYTHIGSYKKMGEVYQTIMKENPNAKNFLNAYIKTPIDTKEDELETRILWNE